VADYAAIAAAGKSIERLLNASFEKDEPIEGKKTRAVLVRTSDLEPNAVATSIGSPSLSIFFYRVDFDKVMRAPCSAIGSQDGRGRLAVDLHFLITPWADNSEFELRIIGKAMQSLETTPVLSGPLLHPSAAWGPNESVQVVMEEISTEAVMRTFDSLPTDFRLSVPYIARNVRIDAWEDRPDAPVTTLVTGMKPGLEP